MTDDARLDALDRRARAAVRTLLHDLRDRGEQENPSLLAEDAAPASTGSTAGPFPDVPTTPGPSASDVDWPVGRPPRTGRRRVVVAAAIAAAAALVAAVAVTTANDGAVRVQSGGPDEDLLPGWLPGGMQPVQVTAIPDAGSAGFAYDIAVYGDPDAADPWAAPVTVTHLAADQDLLGGALPDGDTVTVAGHEARVTRTEPFGEPSPRPAWEVAWRVDDGLLVVKGELARDEILAVAETAAVDPATGQPAIDPAALPDGFAELARGPMVDSTLVTSLFEGADDGSGLAVTYASPAGDGRGSAAVTVAQRPGPATAVDLLRLAFVDSDETSVRGRPAAIGRGTELPGSAGERGVVAVQWAEPDDQLLTVVGFGVAEEDVLKVADGLHPASAGEVAALREALAVAPAREFGAVPEGQVVAAAGASPTGRWRIVADPRRPENIGALTIDRLWGAIASTSSTTGDRTEPPLDLQADISDRTVVVWGIAWVDAASVTAEAPGREPVELGLHEVPGWDHTVVAGAFPADYDTGAGNIEIVARDGAGREVARNSTVLGSNG